MILNMGRSTRPRTGCCALILGNDGETVVRMMPDIGFLHTGMRKPASQVFTSTSGPLTDRIDYLCR